MAAVHIDQNYLIAVAEIQDLHARYFQALDSGNEAEVRACFMHDVEAIYHTRPRTIGLEALMADSLTPFFRRLESEHTKIATHFMGNFKLNRLDGGIAETEVYAIAFGVRSMQPTDEVAMMSLRYLDRLVRTAEGWRIGVRLQTRDWSCQVPVDFTKSMSGRITDLPARLPERFD